MKIAVRTNASSYSQPIDLQTVGRRKLKCSGDHPTCARCAAHDLTCEFSFAAQSGRPRKRICPSVDVPAPSHGMDEPGRSFDSNTSKQQRMLIASDEELLPTSLGANDCMPGEFPSLGFIPDETLIGAFDAEQGMFDEIALGFSNDGPAADADHDVQNISFA